MVEIVGGANFGNPGQVKNLSGSKEGSEYHVSWETPDSVGFIPLIKYDLSIGDRCGGSSTSLILRTKERYKDMTHTVVYKTNPGTISVHAVNRKGYSGCATITIDD